MPASAENASSKSDPKTSPSAASHDLRRAYEHLGRVDILEGALAGTHFRFVTALTNLAQQRIDSGNTSEAADLLRAAEHICFAALAPDSHPETPPVVAAELRAAIAEELTRTLRRSEEHWSDAPDSQPHETIAAIYTASVDQARLAFSCGAFRPALELARAAEALANTAAGAGLRLDDVGSRELLAS